MHFLTTLHITLVQKQASHIKVVTVLEIP